MDSKLNITVMLGGFSAEREVSLKTGTVACKENLAEDTKPYDCQSRH